MGGAMDTAKFLVAIGIVLAIAGFGPWLLDQRGYHMPPFLILSCGLIAIVAAAACLYYAFYPNLIAAIAISFVAGIAVTWWWIGPDITEATQKYVTTDLSSYEMVTGKTFRSERVVLDRRKFVRNHFDSVTFVYDGTAPLVFTENTLSGKSLIKTNNERAQAYMDLGSALGVCKMPLEIQPGSILEPAKRIETWKE